MTTYAANNRPVVFLDVDGVFNPDATSKQRSQLWYHHGWRRKRAQLNSGPVQLIVNPETGIWLRKLAHDTGAELVWATRWNDLANEHVAPLANLPVLPYVTTPVYPRPKAPAVLEWAAGRPFAWIDDEEKELALAERLAAPGQAIYPVLTDARTGLTIEHVDDVRDWLSRKATT
jgi:hypothetical protein